MPDTENSIEEQGIPEITLTVTALSTTQNAVDATLRNAGEAADAKAAGDAIRALESTVGGLNAETLYMDDEDQTETNTIAAKIGDMEEAVDGLGEAIEGLSGTVDDAVLVTAQTLTDAQKTQVRANIGAAAAAGVVLVTAQTLTAAQQTQVRENIGAVGASGISDVIRHSAQTLTTAQQEQARANIGAGDNTRVTVVAISNLTGLPQTITDARITADMVVVHSVLSNPVAQLCDWTVTAANGSLVIAKAGVGSGIGYGGTDLTLYMEKTGSDTAQVSVIKQEYATSVAGLYYARTFTESDEENIFTSVVRAGRIQIYKSGQNISVRLLAFTFDSALTAGTSYILATLPENCRIMLMQQSVFISYDGQYRGLITVSAGTGAINIVPWGTNIPAGTTVELAMPVFNVARDHDDQDVTGFTLMTPTGS